MERVGTIMADGLRQEIDAVKQGRSPLKVLRRQDIGPVELTLEQWTNNYYHVRIGFSNMPQTYPLPCDSKVAARRTFKAFVRAAAALILDGKRLTASDIMAEAMMQGWTRGQAL